MEREETGRHFQVFKRFHKGQQSLDQTFVLRKTRFDPILMSFQGLLGASKVSPGPSEG